jgi:LysR family cys regulon transcriptional activator
MAMTLQQLRCLHQVVESGLSVSRAAAALHTTQPGVSKMVRSLEREIGVEIFVRKGNRLATLTDAGREALALARRVLRDSSALAHLGTDLRTDTAGTLRVGTTHIHARYSLIDVARRFFAKYPAVKLEFTIGPPVQILRGVIEGAIDIGLSTLPEKVPEDVMTLKAYAIERCLIVPKRHPLLALDTVSIEDIARYPLITYDDSYTSGWVVQREFQRRGLAPRVVMRAMDASVIKAYVAAGIGIAIFQKMALEPARDRELRTIATDHIFPASTAMVSLRSDHLLRPFGFDFIHMAAPQWSREAIERRLRSRAGR